MNEIIGISGDVGNASIFSTGMTLTLPPEPIGYWTYASNRALAVSSPPIAFHTVTKPPWRTILLMRLFNIYWIKKEL